jgi:hypothetical protein
MRFLLLGAVVLALSACGNNNDKPASPTDSIQADSANHSTLETTEPGRTPPDTMPSNVQIDTVINIVFSKDSSVLTARGSINKKSEPVICYLQVEKPGSINGIITPDDSELNVRFSQIYMPDNTSDGPFTRQLNYNLKQKGKYKIIIAPNNMAEGKRSGDFTLRLELR